MRAYSELLVMCRFRLPHSQVALGRGTRPFTPGRPSVADGMRGSYATALAERYVLIVCLYPALSVATHLSRYTALGC